MPPVEKGRGGPFVFFFLDLLPRWEKGFPSGPWPPWHGRGESPSEIGYVSLSLSVSAFCSAALSPFRIYMEIRKSDWAETFAVIFYQKLAFLRPKKGINRLMGGPRGSGARPPASWTPRASSRVDFSSQKSYIFQKNLRQFLFVWTPFDMGFLRNIKHATNRNWHWALDQYVSPKNSIKSCQKYMKVVEYWHETIKNYRYDGDLSRRRRKASIVNICRFARVAYPPISMPRLP